MICKSMIYNTICVCLHAAMVTGIRRLIALKVFLLFFSIIIASSNPMYIYVLHHTTHQQYSLHKLVSGFYILQYRNLFSPIKSNNIIYIYIYIYHTPLRSNKRVLFTIRVFSPIYVQDIPGMTYYISTQLFFFTFFEKYKYIRMGLMKRI
jgi:hypothetical protein